MKYPNRKDYTMVYVTHKGFEEWSGTAREYEALSDDVRDEWKGYPVERICDELEYIKTRISWDLIRQEYSVMESFLNLST